MSESWPRILWVSWIAQVLAIVGFSFVYPFLPLYIQNLGVHDRQSVLIWSGALYGGTTVAMAICSPIWGSLSDRFGRKMMVVRAMASGAILVGLMIVVQNPGELLAIRILQGALTGSVAASQALVSAAVPRERLGFSMGLMQMALFAGSSIGPLMGGQLDERLGYRPTFLIAAGMLALAALLVLLFVQEEFTPAARRPGGVQIGFWSGARTILADRQIALLILVLCAVQFGGQIVGPILPLFVQDLGSGSRDAAVQAGNLFAAAGVGSAITAVAIGRLTDHIGHFKPVLLAAAAATALLYIPHYAVTSIGGLYILRGLVGLSIGAMLATASAMLALGTPRELRGAAIGLSAGLNSAGMAVGQFGGTALASGFGIRSVFLVTAAVLAAVSLAIGLWLREPPRDDPEPASSAAMASTSAGPPALPAQPAGAALVATGTQLAGDPGRPAAPDTRPLADIRPAEGQD